MKPKYLLIIFLILFVYSIIALNSISPMWFIKLRWEALGISLIFLCAYFILRVKQSQNKEFRKRSISIGIACAVLLVILMMNLIQNSEGLWVFFIKTFFVFMIGGTIGLFISEIIQWGIVSFKKD